MKTLTSVLTVAVFLFILYKKKIKKKKGKEADAAASSGSEPSTASPAPLVCDGSSFPISLGCGNENTRYDLMVFDLQAFPDNTMFEDHFETKLSLKQKEFITKGYPYRFDFITIATSILVLVTYEVI